MNKKFKGQLVCQHLENISREALETYQSIIREYVKGKRGVYALYKKGKLYYVGLASNLRSRLKHHFQDRHAQSWDRFSIYLTGGDEHLKELETLVLRIASPKGNRTAGKFTSSEDLRRKFRSQIAKYQRKELYGLFGEYDAKSELALKPKKSLQIKTGRTATLANYIKNRLHIRFRYKDRMYIAHVRRDGTITFARDSAEAARLQGKVFTSPSLAAVAVTGHTMDGWSCWKYQNSKGEWVLIDKLRKKK